jgi:hypothetical protein
VTAAWQELLLLLLLLLLLCRLIERLAMCPLLLLHLLLQVRVPPDISG